MTLPAMFFTAVLYIVGLLMLHLALVEARRQPVGDARRFRTDLEWIIPGAAGFTIHALIVYALVYG